MRPATAAVLLVALAGCTRQTPNTAGTRNIILVSAENLSGDPSLDWISSAIPRLLALQLEGLPNLAIQTVDRYQDAAGIPRAETLLCRYQNEQAKLNIRCWTETRESPVVASGNAGSLTDWIAPLGRYLEPKAPAMPPVPSGALQAMAAHRYADAVKLAPDFAPAYLEGIAYAVRQRDDAQVKALVEAAAGAESKFSPIGKARLRLVRAGLAQARAEELGALEELDKLLPPDENRQRAELTLLQALGRNADAAALMERHLQLHPNQTDDWNPLAYLRAWGGDLNGAIQAIEKYQSLTPNQANALDSKGEIYYRFGRFAEAEKSFLESDAKDPAFNGRQALYKAAISRLMAGNAAGGKEIYSQFAAAHGEEKAALEAHWLYMTGQTSEAALALRTAAKAQKGDPAARSFTQLAFWAAAHGDWAAARQELTSAVSQQPSNATRAFMAAVALAASPEGDEALLRDQATKMFPAPQLAPIRDGALALALLFHRKPAEAATVAASLRKMESGGGERFTRVLLARSLHQAGKTAEAAEQMKVHLVPAIPTTTPWESWLTQVELQLLGK